MPPAREINAPHDVRIDVDVAIRGGVPVDDVLAGHMDIDLCAGSSVQSLGVDLLIPIEVGSTIVAAALVDAIDRIVVAGACPNLQVDRWRGGDFGALQTLIQIANA